MSFLDNNPLTVKRWEDYGFDLDRLEEYKLYDISAATATDLGFRPAHDGIYIEYPRKEDSRVRWIKSGFAAATEGGKYGQRPGTMPALYVPPTIDPSWTKNSSIPILITEGEFKACAVDMIANLYGQQPSVVPCAVGGVFSWQSKKLGFDMIPEMKDISWLGRTVYIAFDMDQQDNAMVALALTRIVNKLGGLGALIKVPQWPAAEGKGIDDYLTGSQLPRDSWLHLVETAQTPGHIISVLELNERFTYTEVMQQVYDSQNNTYITTRSFSTDFFTRTVKVQTGIKNNMPVFKDIPVGAYWLSSPLRAACVESRFLPGATRRMDEDGKTYLNTWLGWGKGLRGKGLTPVKGNVAPFYDFMYTTFGTEDKAHVDYLIKRLAWMFQQPTKKHPTWIYLMGRPLQGKSTLIKIISSLVGNAYTANVDEAIVKSQFAEWRTDKLLVTFDDSSVNEVRTLKQLLKRLTTEDNSQVNLKYLKAYTAESYFTFFFATNSLEALLDHDDRRALVLEAECPWDFAKGEWTAFDTWRSNPENLAALLHHFLYEVKIEAAFYSEIPPKTKARELVVETGESTWDDLINYIVLNPQSVIWRSPASHENRRMAPSIVTGDMLRALFTLRNGDIEKYRISNASLVSKLSRYGFRKCEAACNSDTRNRIQIMDEQVTLWTCDRNWHRRTRQEYTEEYVRLMRAFPELFPSHVKSKF